MKIIISDPLPSSAAELLKNEGWTVDARTGRSAEELTKDIKDAVALIVRSATKVTAQLIASAPERITAVVMGFTLIRKQRDSLGEKFYSTKLLSTLFCAATLNSYIVPGYKLLELLL